MRYDLWTGATMRPLVQRRDLRHGGRRRQERHSISTATASSIITMTQSPKIPSLVGRFMIKPSMEKRGEANLRK
jgi:hypothetical protein